MKEVFEKIIEILENKAHEAEKDMQLSDSYADAQAFGGKQEGYENAIEIVKQEAEDHNNYWIPFSEPPKTNCYILLSFSNFSVPMVGRYEENDEGGAYYIGDMDETCAQQDLFVNAWKPLPEPYQPNSCQETNCPYNDGNECPAAEGCAGYERKQTNADRIRSMGDEDLTKIIMCPYDTAGKPIEIMPCVSDGNVQKLVTQEDCKKCMMKWLQSEVEE